MEDLLILCIQVIAYSIIGGAYYVLLTDNNEDDDDDQDGGILQPCYVTNRWTMNIQQVEECLKEASMEYIRHGANKAEVEYYAKYLLELQREENKKFLEDNWLCVRKRIALGTLPQHNDPHGVFFIISLFSPIGVLH